MIVVADTSPLNYLNLLGQIDILHVLYGRILVPHAVLDELLNAEAPPVVRHWAANPPHWLELLSPSTTRIANIPKLDRGETEAIALAEELNADWLLIDELAGRREALNRGIQTVGAIRGDESGDTILIPCGCALSYSPLQSTTPQPRLPRLQRHFDTPQLWMP